MNANASPAPAAPPPSEPTPTAPVDPAQVLAEIVAKITRPAALAQAEARYDQARAERQRAYEAMIAAIIANENRPPNARDTEPAVIASTKAYDEAADAVAAARVVLAPLRAAHAERCRVALWPASAAIAAKISAAIAEIDAALATAAALNRFTRDEVADAALLPQFPTAPLDVHRAMAQRFTRPAP